MEITGPTPLGERMARIAARFFSIDPTSATTQELEWSVRAERHSRSIAAARVALYTAELEHRIATERPDLGSPTDTTPDGTSSGDDGAHGSNGTGGGGDSPSTGGTDRGGPGTDDDDLGLPARSGPCGEGGPTGNDRETAEEYRQRLRRAKWLRRLESFAEALEAGTITIASIDALANVLEFVEPTVVADVLADDEGLLEVARTVTRTSFVRYLQLRVDAVRTDEGAARLQRQIADSFAVLGEDDDLGMAKLFMKLDPVRGQQVATAIRNRADQLHQTGDYTGVRRGQVLAQAVCDLICGHASRGAGGAEILVLVDLVSLLGGTHHDTISETGDGLPLPLDTIRDLCRQPAATITAAVTDAAGIVTAIGHHTAPADAGGSGDTRHGLLGDIPAAVAAAIASASGDQLHMGRQIRLANRTQRRALRAMYRTCAHPGCSERFADCFIHHLVTWDDGGPTDLDLLVPLCGRHHHQIHDAHWHLTIDHRRTLRWHRPNRTLDTEARYEPLGATRPVRHRAADDGASGTGPCGRDATGDLRAAASAGSAITRRQHATNLHPTATPAWQRSRSARGSPPATADRAAPTANDEPRPTSAQPRLFDPPAA